VFWRWRFFFRIKGTSRRYLQKKISRLTGTIYCSVADPDPHGSAFILVGWIRIRIQQGKINQDLTIFIGSNLKVSNKTRVPDPFGIFS